jgi:hypothetical protein
MSTSPAALNPYAIFLGERKPIEVISETSGVLENLSRKIGPARIGVAPAPGKWSPSEILCHLADCEIAFGFRLRQTLAEDNHVIQPFDQEKWAQTYGNLKTDEALATFSALRHWNLLLINGTLADFGSKPVTHPERGTMTFATIVETMAGHDLNHISQLERIAG